MIIDNASPSNVVSAFGLVWPDALRIRGSVIRIAFPPVFIMTGYGVGIAFLIKSHPEYAISLTVMSLISLVLSLLLVFRTNSAYDRYWEGRKIWQDLKVSSRNLIRSFWVSVMENSIEDSVMKRQAMKNVAAFAISVKHYLRGEDGLDYADYDGLLSPEFRLQYTSRNNAYNYGAIPASGSNSPEMVVSHGSHLHIQQTAEGWERSADTPLPSQVLYELQKFCEHIQDNHLIHVQFYASLLTSINTLGTLVGSCERIVSTPIPLAYRIHLHHALYLYLLVLPWALDFKSVAKTIVIQFVVSFMMIGIDCISREIQNPFGYDANDLPLDNYCESVLIELSYALRHRAPKALDIAEDTMSNSVDISKTGGGAAPPGALATAGTGSS
ncbi:hypothetical protein GGI15_001934 [Coemansia interrupta]|uniref:Uncharacterized protein n=1 Tax=Coemansia interrupta TaxID=1126814 RepID=A0A9W8HHX8_9FUNG|nr:hypothetical protein GGI15_001934 [Coemansia interrupta]